MPNRANVSVPLNLSYNTRGGLAFANLAKDQRRLNGIYAISRPAAGVPPDIVLEKRPGVADFGSTFGAGTQVQYLVARDPAGTWDPTPWLFVKDGTANKAVNASTSTTVLTSADFFPRFWDTININGTETLYVQFQNATTPSGAGNQRVYQSTAIATFTEITDGDFTGLNHRGKIEPMDGFLFVATNQNRIAQCAVNAIGTWAPTDYLTKSISQDAPQGLAKHRNQILFFGVDTVEPFVNQGNATGSVLSRIAYGAQRIGLGNVAGGGAGLAGKTNYYCNTADLMFFVGRFGGQADDACLIAYDGQRFEKVSRPYEDKILSSTEIYSVNKIAFRGYVGVAIQLTAPTATPQKSLVFFPELNEFFEFESTVWTPVNNGTHYAGLANTQKVYVFQAENNWQDAGTSYDFIVQFRLDAPDLAWRTMTHCGVIADTASSELLLSVQFSDDDGATWSTARTIDLAQLRKELFACGGFRSRMVRLSYTGSQDVRLRKFFASIGN